MSRRSSILSRALALAVALAVTAAGHAADSTGKEIFVIDPAHSQPMFEVRHLGFSVQRGMFAKATGRVELDRVAKQGSVDVVIDTTSIRTSDQRLDVALKGQDFFNVEKYPVMNFKSSRIAFETDQVVGIAGELTLLGQTRPVALKVVNFACGTHPFNKRPMCGAEATATIKRSDWGMTYGIPDIAGDEVKITIPIEAYKD